MTQLILEWGDPMIEQISVERLPVALWLRPVLGDLVAHTAHSEDGRSVLLSLHAPNL
jgi:hypothetical protein